MGVFVLEEEVYKCLKKLYKEDSIGNEDKKILENSDIVILNEQGRLTLNKKGLYFVENSLNYDFAMTVKKKCNGKMEESCYFLRDDHIILTKKEEEYIFINLPTIKYAIGSVADLIWDENIQKVEESYKITFEEEVNLDNYIYELNQLNMKEEYQLSEVKKDEIELLFTGVDKNKEKQNFIVVRILDGVARYYIQEVNKIIYGRCGKSNLINIICQWMVKMHRELVEKILGEEYNYAIHD